VVVHLIDGTYELFRYFLAPAVSIDRSAPEADFAAWAERLGTPALHQRALMLAAARG